MSEPQLSAGEISRRITTGIGMVYDLFKELHSLFRLISQGLENSDADIQLQGPKGYILARGKNGTSVADRFLKTDMGLLVALGTGNSDEPEDEVDDLLDEDDLGTETDKAKIDIQPSTQYLAVRAILFDPQADPVLDQKPILIAATLNSITKSAKAGKKKASNNPTKSKFQIRRTAIKLLVKQLRADAQAGQGITARPRAAILNAQLGEVLIKPLAEIRSEDDVNAYVDRLVAMIEF